MFLVSVFLPWTIELGSLAFSPYRIVLIAMVVPCLLRWVGGKAGRIRVPDVLLFLYCFWSAISLTVVHGLQQSIEPAGILFIETVGAYLLARTYIRDASDFCGAVRLLFVIVAVLAPFAILEALSNHDILLELFSAILPSHPIAITEPRWGLRRVQGTLDHPILFGVVCGSILALVHLVLGYQEKPPFKWAKSGTVAVTSFLALSSGPLTALVFQALMIAWDWLLGGYAYRWKILWALLFLVYVFIEIASNQSVPEFFITHFSFDTYSANYRVLIWTFGSESVLNHPLFGVGFNRWDRPIWMPGSIDMFWLTHAIYYGIPGVALITLSFFALLYQVSIQEGLNEKLREYRTAYLIAMGGFFLVGWTVHFWNATYVLFIFLWASGAWMLNIPTFPAGRANLRGRVEGKRGQKRQVENSAQMLGPAEKVKTSLVDFRHSTGCEREILADAARRALPPDQDSSPSEVINKRSVGLRRACKQTRRVKRPRRRPC
ncbi:O-antigen ligase domain-containing protein [Ensifer sp. IC3342]|nr:O-antigen ligase domain-containing protein [Ensifer sp. BRP08]MCA1448753.1 O-antigen ligase domain-containing protein [Ensifer sp. IC3342]